MENSNKGKGGHEGNHGCPHGLASPRCQGAAKEKENEGKVKFSGGRKLNIKFTLLVGEVMGVCAVAIGVFYGFFVDVSCGGERKRG